MIMLEVDYGYGHCILGGALLWLIYLSPVLNHFYFVFQLSVFFPQSMCVLNSNERFW